MYEVILLAIKESILYVLVSYAIYIAFKILRFPDLSIDNVFSFGSISGAFYYILTGNIYMTIVLLILSSIVLSFVTSSLYSYLKISKLFSGILVFTMLYSINLKFFRVPNVSLDINLSIYEITFIVGIVVVLLFLLLKTFLGKFMIIYGDNISLLKELKINEKIILWIGLFVSTILVSLSGFFTSLYFGFADVSIGFGVLINGVAGVLLGDIIGRKLNINNDFINIFIGVFLFNMILSFVSFYLLNEYIETTDLKLLSSIILIIVLYLNNKKSKDLFGI